MLITYALVALLAGALIAIVVLWTRLKGAKQRGRQSAADVSGPATVTPIDARADISEDVTEKDDYDSEATRVYMRTSHDLAFAAPRKRDGASPDVPAGARLVGLSGCQKGNSFFVVVAGITVGRSASCDIVLVDDRVSSHHAWIGIVNGKVMLRDLKSTNGTYLNAQTHASVSEAELRSGDTIFFGGHQGDQFRFMVD